MEARASDQPIEEMPSSLQGSTEVPSKAESILEVQEVSSGHVNALIEVLDQHGDAGTVVKVSLVMVIEGVMVAGA